MVRYCAICTDDVIDETITEYDNYFCTNECNSRYSEMSWVTKTLVYKYNEVFEKLGIWIAFDIWNKHYTDQESKIDCWGRKL
jgi:hypothetical protein